MSSSLVQTVPQGDTSENMHDDRCWEDYRHIAPYIDIFHVHFGQKLAWSSVVAVLFITMHLSPVEPVDWVHGDVEASSEVGDMMEPLERFRSVRQGEAEAKHGEQASQDRTKEHGNLCRSSRSYEVPPGLSTEGGGDDGGKEQGGPGRLQRVVREPIGEDHVGDARYHLEW